MSVDKPFYLIYNIEGAGNRRNLKYIFKNGGFFNEKIDNRR